MIRTKNSGQCASLAPRMVNLDNLMRAPVNGMHRAFHTRTQMAYCPERTGAVDVFEYDVPVTYRKSRTQYIEMGS